MVETTKHQVNEQTQAERQSFYRNVEALKNYIETNKKYPNKRDDTCETSRKLGYFLSDMRSKYTNKNLHISKERIDYISQQIPGFSWNYKRDTFTNQVDQLQEFYDTNKFWPRRNHKDANQDEKKLGKFVAHVRQSYKLKDIPDAHVGYILDEERLNYLYEMIPDFVFSVDKQAQYIETAIQLNIYIETNKKLPRRSGANRDPEEFTLGSFLHYIQQGVKNNKSTIPNILQILDQYCPLFDSKTFKISQ